MSEEIVQHNGRFPATDSVNVNSAQEAHLVSTEELVVNAKGDYEVPAFSVAQPKLAKGSLVRAVTIFAKGAAPAAANLVARSAAGDQVLGAIVPGAADEVEISSIAPTVLAEDSQLVVTALVAGENVTAIVEVVSIK